MGALQIPLIEVVFVLDCTRRFINLSAYAEPNWYGEPEPIFCDALRE